MIIVAYINLLAYAYAVYRAAKFFHPTPDSRRDDDKTMVAGIGVMSALFVVVEAAVVATYPELKPAGRTVVTMLQIFCLANASVYVSIINTRTRDMGCAVDKKRYFP